MLSDTYIALTLNVQYCNICCTPSLFSCPSERLVCWRYIVCVSCWPSDSTSIEKHRTAGPMCTQSPYHTHTHAHTNLHTATVSLIKQAVVYVFTGRVWSVSMIMSMHLHQMSDIKWYQTWCEQSEGCSRSALFSREGCSRLKGTCRCLATGSWSCKD